MTDFLNTVLFSLGGKEITVRLLMLMLIIAIALFFAYRFVRHRFLNAFYTKNEVLPRWQKRINRSVGIIFFTLFLLEIVWSFGLNFNLTPGRSISISVMTVLEGLLILELAQFLNWTINRSFIKRQQSIRSEDKLDRGEDEQKDISLSAGKVVQYALYSIALILIIRNFNLDIVLTTIPIGGADGGQVPIMLSNIMYVVLVFLIAHIISWFLTQLVLRRYYQTKEIDLGTRYAVNQLVSYIIYVIAALIAMQSLGFNLTVILGGIAALLVGVGLGMQETFNDLISGLVLLFERSIEVGDILEFQGQVGVVRKIGLRASYIETRDNVLSLIPNSMLVHQQVINWSQIDEKARFKVQVGVAYGSDTQLVKHLLIKAAEQCPYVLEYPSPIVIFRDFGESSLRFDLLFWSKNYMIIEFVKSDIRFAIDRLFREHQVKIPFPQREVYVNDKRSDKNTSE